MGQLVHVEYTVEVRVRCTATNPVLALQRGDTGVLAGVNEL
jgi:hypothetical protein